MVGSTNGSDTATSIVTFRGAQHHARGAVHLDQFFLPAVAAAARFSRPSSLNCMLTNTRYMPRSPVPGFLWSQRYSI
jgi:hypothetical protein